MRQTINYNLNCYELSDQADLRKLTPNFEIIDAELEEHQDNIAGHETRIDTAELRIAGHETRITRLEEIEDTKIIANDVLIPTTYYQAFSVPKKDQFLQIYLKETDVRVVVQGADLDIDATIAGSFGLYKLYNDAGTWRLLQIMQNRDIIGGNKVLVNFTVNTMDITLNIKSEATNKFVTIFSNDI